MDPSGLADQEPFTAWLRRGIGRDRIRAEPSRSAPPRRSASRAGSGLADCAAVCEIHYRYHVDKPSPTDLEREAANLFNGVIPADMIVTIYCWREKNGGADFHARYLLTEKGGIGIDAGFSAEGHHQTTDVHLMSFEFSQEKIGVFARTATDYELVETGLADCLGRPC